MSKFIIGEGFAGFDVVSSLSFSVFVVEVPGDDIVPLPPVAMPSEDRISSIAAKGSISADIAGDVTAPVPTIIISCSIDRLVLLLVLVVGSSCGSNDV